MVLFLLMIKRYEIENYPEEEKDALRRIFHKKGFKNEKLDSVVDTVSFFYYIITLLLHHL